MNPREDYRLENPRLDRDIEATIEEAMDGNITIDEYVTRCARYCCAMRVMRKAKNLSENAETQYMGIIDAVYEELKAKLLEN